MRMNGIISNNRSPKQEIFTFPIVKTFLDTWKNLNRNSTTNEAHVPSKISLPKVIWKNSIVMELIK